VNVGKRIQHLRLERQITLPDLADLAGVSKGLISQLENAEAPNPSLDTLHKIAKALKVSLAVLLERDSVVSRQAIPDQMDEGLRAFFEGRKKRKQPVDPHVAQALYVLQEREGKPKTAEDWEWLYRSIEMSLNQTK
jgi:transcriptional regulator with XRE-family HTH domain